MSDGVTEKGDCPNCILGIMDEGGCRNCSWREGDPLPGEETEPASAPLSRLIKLTETVRASEFAQAILGTNWWDWEWWSEVCYDEGFGFDKHPANPNTSFLTVRADNPDYDWDIDRRETFWRRVSIKRLAAAYIKYREDGGRESWSDLDMISADNIMQTLVFGKVAYG